MNESRKKSLRLMNRTLGTWMSIGSPVIAEMASIFNFDWLLFDLEHGSFPEASLLANLQSLSTSRTASIVRVGNFDPALIARVLDWGADGIMLPHVSNKEEVIDCLEEMQYPPKGRRGFSRSVRAFNYGLNSPENLNEQETPLLFVQIEDYEGVKNADSIAEVAGVDVLFVGPTDLKLSLTTQTDGESTEYSKALDLVCNAAIKYQKMAGILVRNLSDLPELNRLGFSCYAIGSDLGILREGFRSICELFEQDNFQSHKLHS